MKKTTLTKLLSLLMVAAMLFGTLSAALVLSASSGLTLGAVPVEEEENSGYKDSDIIGYYRTVGEVKELMNLPVYTVYRDKYADVPDGSGDVIINCATDYVAEQTTSNYEVLENFEGKSALKMDDTGKTTFRVYIPKEGMYAMRIMYYPIEGYGTTMERMLYIDGHVPFSEARYLYFPRQWAYELEEVVHEDGTVTYEFFTDVRGDELRPVRVAQSSWEDYFLRDWVGFEMDPFEFYFSEGEHTITLEAAREPMCISQITLYPYVEEAPYEEVLAGWLAQGLTVQDDVEPIKVQAERPTTVSERIILPGTERTSALTEPASPVNLRFNTGGASGCNQWVRYEVDVPKEGLYEIDVRFRQNTLIGMFTSRRVKINGEIQFREASNCRFVYDTPFQVEPLNNGKTSFLFYFKEGKNIVEFEAVAGDMQSYILEIRDMVDELYAAYEKVLKITGPVPDAYRDYGFSRTAPDVLVTFAKTAKRLYEIADELEAITGEMGDQVNALETYALLFKQMAADEYEIAANMLNFKSYTTGLQNWMYTALGQPVTMDYFTIQSPNVERPRAVANFFEYTWYEIRAFFGSFFHDYTTIAFRGHANGMDYEEQIEMWVNGNRDDALIARRIADENFSPQYNIGVTYKVIQVGLMEAIIAGMGPDIASFSSTDAVTWGIREGVMPLNDFEGFDEVSKLFAEAAMIPLTLEDETFGLPNGMSFSMLFYRLDVLAELGIEIPKTWSDLKDVLNVMQNKNITIGLPGGLSMVIHCLYQNGQDLYKDNGMRVNLDSDVAIDAFVEYCDYYTKYDVPVIWDMTRFRTGEVPIFVGDAIATYNGLMSIVELRGLWEMAPMLGTEKEDGTIDCTTGVSVACNVIPRGADNPEATWKYLYWYAQTETQQLYMEEQRAVSGTTVKFNPANLEMILDQPWTYFERSAIETQLQNLTATHEYPGGYLVGVYGNNAFMDAYNNGMDPAKAMLTRIDEMNEELSRKREEYGYQTYEEYIRELKESGSEIVE